MPEALLNYLGRMGWSMPDESEKFSLQTMFDNFDIQRVSLGGPIFDVDKLKWLNGKWLREDLNAEQLGERLLEWAFTKENLLPILEQMQPRLEVFSDLAPAASFLFSGLLPVTEQDFLSSTKLEQEAIVENLQFCLWQLEALQQWERDNIFQAIKAVADHKEIKMKDFLGPVFIAIAGTTSSISVMDSMTLLGPDLSRARLRAAIDVLGGLGKKKMKKLEKAYRAFA